jgi:hypothetical protein
MLSVGDDAPVDPIQAQSARSFWLLAGGILAAQIVLILGLSDRTPLVARMPPPTPRFRLAPHSPLAPSNPAATVLGDPTLFSRLSARGFSGRAWLEPPRLAHELREWSAPVQWLRPDQEALGAGLGRLVQGPPVVALAGADKPPPGLTAVRAAPPPLPTRSVLRVEGPLAGRPLAAPLELPGWPASELVRDSVVQVAVAPSGEVVFATLLSVRGPKSAEQQQADARALDLARGARFQPRPVENGAEPLGGGGLDWGTLVFRWQTVSPLPTPAAPVASPTP